MPKKLVLFFLVLLSFGFVESKAQAESKKALFKSLFLFNFTKYIEWPADYNAEEFSIGVVEDNVLFEQLTLALKSKNVHNKKTKVVFMSSLSGADSLNMLYVPSISGYTASMLFKAIGNQPVVLVTEGYPFNSTMFNFVEIEDRLQFELNEANLKRQGLIVSNKLENLATSVSKDGNKAMVTTEAEWLALLNQTKTELKQEKSKTSQLSNENEELSSEVKTLSTDLQTLKSQKKELQENIKKQGTELEEIYGRIGLQKDVYQKLTKELEAKNSEIESKEQALFSAEQRLKDQLSQLEETTRANIAMEEKMNLTARLLDSQKTINLFIIAIALIIAVLGVIAYRNYRLQQKQSEVIAKQKQEVEMQSKEIQVQHEEVKKQRDRSDELLLNILPAEVAQELKEKGQAEARDFDLASILFTDFKDFTEASAKLSAQDLLSEINTCFEAFDGIIAKYNVEKIKTIGDSYMAAGGLPVRTDDSVKNTVSAALEMQAFIVTRHKKQIASGLPAFEMRVGIHTGPVVAGIVGVKKFQYDIWGDTVNTASRMESNGEVGKVNISQATYELLVAGDSHFEFENRGMIEAKGKGEIAMWFVT